MMFPEEEFHLNQQKEFLPFHFTTDLRYFTEPEFQREIPIQMLEQRYANENASWDAVACGNTEAALKACQQMARFTYGGRFFRLTVPDQDHADRNEHSAAQSH